MRPAEPAWREMTEAERKILSRLLDESFPGRDALRQQAKDCRVRPYDEHGCLEFDVSADIEAPDEKAPVEGWTEDADGVRIDVLLFVKEGKLSELEFNKLGGSSMSGLPSPEALEVVVLPQEPD